MICLRGQNQKFVSLNQMASEPLAALTRKDYPHHHKHLEKLFATIGREPRVSRERDSGTSLTDGRIRGRARIYPSAELRESRG